MVMVAMREDGVGDPCAAVGDHAAYPLEVVVVEGPGVDDHRLGGTRLEQDPGVGAVEGHRPGVGGQHTKCALGDLPAAPQHGPTLPRGRMTVPAGRQTPRPGDGSSTKKTSGVALCRPAGPCG